ncbi:MAG TPA: UDP-N-acetylmuramoyl-L-alanyl-D-glutamate--2,6-diaminopimelate ligase [Clostridiales bacterium]|jgi:UDP-N-acetylmuramoyl-L-alanyl-D-glutamate--2,6-diaminopimelate ligase|nr:UDP-N-acetylmuramoyl-L-alanyl-D-glutamate--2,6-diaminopimelate ligase [Clostridiales bacterium]
MKLSELLSSAGLPCVNKKHAGIQIGHVCCDSRVARADSVFVCIRGAVTDGHLYARSAYNLGCLAFVGEYKLDLPGDAAVVICENPRFALARLSAVLFGFPSRRLKVIGVTGTKGKTTTALMIAGILNRCGIPTGYIGSNGILFDSFRHHTANTTPESCDLQRYMFEMAECGIKYLALEVSSQAVYLERIRYLDFDTCVFTNLSPDHIGGAEHPDFNHYKACKARLFSEYNPARAVVNANDPHTPDIIRNYRGEITTFGLGGSAHITAGNITLLSPGNVLGTAFDFISGTYKKRTTLSLPGDFNIQNALAAAAVCQKIIPDTDKILSVLEDIKVEGRFECMDALPYATIVIDYAHNGISLSSVLRTLRAYNPRRLICLLGSVGGRTQMRRRELGAIASALCDFCILTADNPDCEDPVLVIRDIASAFVPGGCDYISIPDRREAIMFAVGMLREGDILLLAGKGHENYQLIKGIKWPFSEKEIVLEAAARILKSPV